ncbi:MAG: YebC/PmpR family DNA-binding transcriptional regulator [Candidatus Gracilibacteria bacterium]|jgi:YebC/PmpR family DNA-binding regulatory protein
MSGHSKWKTIKIKKGAADAKRGKIFTTHAKLIAIAAQAGGDPSMNASLKIAIERAKGDNVPNSNIERAIKKGTGEDKDAAAFEEITYEAMGPSGSAFLIDTITDNKNRTLSNVRSIVTKYGGSIGAPGSVLWRFDKKAFLIVDPCGKSADEAELTLIDCGADDLKLCDGKYEVYAGAEKLATVKKAITDAGFRVEKDELIWQAKDEISVTDLGVAQKILNFMDAVDEDDDVVRVSNNVDISDELVAKLG